MNASIRASSLWGNHPDYAADETTALEQFIFEHLRTKTAQLEHDPDWVWNADVIDERIDYRTFATDDVFEIGRLFVRRRREKAEVEARALLKIEFDSIKRG